MNKSHLSHANNSHPVVTPHDIGNFVKVSGVGTGILRFVGSIRGKDGLFCGIELDHAIGKHNGTYQGVSYFVCPPERGIFAPLYKVELDEPDDVPMMSLSQIGRGVERLSRSALPALQLKNVARPEDPMTTSIFSQNSMMDTSAFSQVSWGDITDMCASNTTYVIPPGKGLFDEEDDLMTVEAPQSVVAIDRDAIRREEERLLGASYVVEKPHFAKERLPVVEDDEDDPDLITPMVENRPLTGEQSSQGSWNGSQESELAHSSTHSNAENEPEEELHQGEEENDKTPAATTPAAGLQKKGEKESPRGKMEIAEKKAPKKAADEPPPAPKFPVKPKTPSKHQLMMQQLKASIEADKTKPKKEIKARVPLIPPAAPPAKQKENEGDKVATETPKRMIKQPLKAVNETPKAVPPVERPKKERKPLYVAPPPKEKVEKKEAAAKPSFVPVTKKAPSRESVNQEKKEKPKSSTQFPTSSFAGGKPRTSSSSTNKSAQKKTIAESEKLARLLTANSASLAFALTAQHLQSQKKDLAKRLGEIEAKLVEEQKNSENLRTRLGQVEKNHKEDVERMKNHSEQLTKSHAEAIERLKNSHENQLQEKTKETEKSLEDEKHRHDAEMEAMNRRHQKVIVALDEKIAESEKIAEQLKADKKSLQLALANDSDQRNQMLTKEINSLQTALELKSNEMKELRQKFQQVALRVEEIPLKELEITKLKHKVTELKQALDQKLTYERLLVNQNEELKRQQMLIEEEKDSMKRSIDVMMYHYENGDDPMTSSRHSSATPGKVTFRSRSSNSSHRPNSGIPPEARLSISSCAGEMERSVDARDSLTRSTISMYASQYKLPENHAEDVIYAPDQIIAGGSITSSLSEEDALLHVNGNDADPQTDSGIVLS